MRICLFSESLRRPYDEGIKNFAVGMIQGVSRTHQVLALTTSGAPDAQYGIQNTEANRLLLSLPLRRQVRDFQPQAIVYVPTSSTTVFGLARARALRSHGRGVPTALVALQPRRHTPLGRLLVRLLTADCIFAQSAHSVDALRVLRCRSELLPPAVDATRFRPATRAEKAMLRTQYGIPANAYVVTHVGHLKHSRNLECFLALQALPDCHGLVVASTSTPQDQEVKNRLIGAGVTVLDTFVANIEDVYRLSDLYVFLAEQEDAAIEMPLSVLEAMACNLAVVSTPFGGLPDFFAAGQGLYYWQGQGEFGGVVENARVGVVATRKLVAPFTWEAAAQTLLRVLVGSEGAS